MRDMHSIYFNMTTTRLRDLKSEKYLRVLMLRKSRMGYFQQQELRKLEVQMKWIDAVIRSRDEQEGLFP